MSYQVCQRVDMDFELNADAHEYIDSGIADAIATFNGNVGNVVDTFKFFDDRVSAGSVVLYSQKSQFDALYESVEAKIAEFETAISDLNSGMAAEEVDAGAAYDAGDGVSIGNRIVNIVEIGSSLWSANPDVGWNTDAGSRSDFIAGRIQPFIEEIERLEYERDRLRELRDRTRGAKELVADMIDICRTMAGDVLALRGSEAGYTWTTFRMSAYNDTLKAFKNETLQTDLASALTLDSINTTYFDDGTNNYLSDLASAERLNNPYSLESENVDFLGLEDSYGFYSRPTSGEDSTTLPSWMSWLNDDPAAPGVGDAPVAGVDEGEYEPGMGSAPAGGAPAPDVSFEPGDGESIAREETVRLMRELFPDGGLDREVQAGNIAASYLRGEMESSVYLVNSPELAAYLDWAVDPNLPYAERHIQVSEVLYNLSA